MAPSESKSIFAFPKREGALHRLAVTPPPNEHFRLGGSGRPQSSPQPLCRDTSATLPRAAMDRDHRAASLAAAPESSSTSRSHRAADASLGMRQSPRGDKLTVPTLGPSGRQERLNCWVKKRV